MVTKDEEMRTKHEIKEFLFSQKCLEERAIEKFSTIQINTRQCTAIQRNTEKHRATERNTERCRSGGDHVFLYSTCQ